MKFKFELQITSTISHCNHCETSLLSRKILGGLIWSWSCRAGIIDHAVLVHGIAFLLQSLDAAVQQRTPGIQSIGKKGEEIVVELKSNQQSALGIEQCVSSLNEKWDELCLLIGKQMKRLALSEKKRKFQLETKQILTVVTEIEIWIQTIIIEHSKDPQYQTEQIKVGAHLIITLDRKAIMLLNIPCCGITSICIAMYIMSVPKTLNRPTISEFTWQRWTLFSDFYHNKWPFSLKINITCSSNRYVCMYVECSRY